MEQGEQVLICPKCGAQFDSTWKICLHDNAFLVEGPPGSGPDKDYTHAPKASLRDKGIRFVGMSIACLPLGFTFFQGLAHMLTVKFGWREPSGLDGTTVGMGMGIGMPGMLLSVILFMIGLDAFICGKYYRAIALSALLFLSIGLAITSLFF